MSYQVLARKYRPKSFQTLVGQEHVVRALTHALEQQRLHHAYLFTGTRGVGKTTLSRILAKSLNCETGITAQPCGVCDACMAIDAGRFVDYIEMDAASNRGVDEMVQLLEQAVYAPSNARFKVYMIDEVHMLTNFAFNAMLKTLEEPPAHVKFILATTDPQKIPVTVLSRCLQFNLKQMPPLAIVDHLQDILGQEQIDFDVPALRLLAKGAQGSMRDALSLTDQAIAYAAGKVTLDAVQGMLGALDQRYLIAILDALVSADGAGLLAVADQMAARSLSYKVALQDLAALLHQISVAQLVPTAVADDCVERDDIMRLAQVIDGDQIHLFYQIAVHGRNELGLAPDEYAGFSMTLLRMLAYRPVSADFPSTAAFPRVSGTGASINVGNGSGNNGGNNGGKSARAGGIAAARQAVVRSGSAVVAPPVALNSVAQPVIQPVRSAVPLPSALASPSPTTAVPSALPPGKVNPAMAALAKLEMARNERNGQPGRGTAAVASPVLAPVLASIPSAPPWEELDALDAAVGYMPASAAVAEKKTELISDAAPHHDIASTVSVMPLESVVPPALVITGVQMVNGAAWDGDWPRLVTALTLRGVAQQLALQSELVGCEVDDSVVTLKLRVPLETLLSAGSVDKLTAVLASYFVHTVRLELEIGSVFRTAHAQVIVERAHRQQEAETALQHDPVVLALMQELGAVLVPGSIRAC